MTTDYGWTEEPFNSQDQEPVPDGMSAQRPVHVKVVATESQRVAPEFAGMQTVYVGLAGTDQPTQICPHRYHRYKCKFLWSIPADTIVYVATKPDALGSPAPPPTIYQLTPSSYFGTMPDYDAQEPLYAVYTGTGPVTVSVMDESYGTVQ